MDLHGILNLAGAIAVLAAAVALGTNKNTANNVKAFGSAYSGVIGAEIGK